ncbi:SMI1/KNR4 family protein [Streptomyces sp. TRM 70361]|uniref:SMI1/KNR4 family protein n=1 Tax=Streptomyces sp. TRM 70361 TaxID=3116553 RepID=UPI002E7BF963|nr:SMI1/KNR4 family protein [Streptomyces sp. TRM 70361]MEE1942826.1 SMI1/KNR4 family protein [Streptomyces sp. TRM 70361]
MVEQVARRMAGKTVTDAPEGWARAVLSGRAGGGGSSMTGGYTVPGVRASALPSDMHSLLKELAEAVREDRGWEPVSWEMDCRSSGEYRLTVFTDAVGRVSGQGGGYEIVLAPGYRLPQPGLRQAAGTAAPAGDPESAATRFRAYLERRAAVLGHPEELPPPATTAALDEAERRIGRPLPADLRALYLIADGDGIGHRHRHLIGGHAWLSLESLVAENTEWREWQDRPWLGWDLEWNAVVFDATPADTVRRCGDHPGWIRFAADGGGNHLAVDTAPARDGRPGQVIATGRDHDEGPEYVADSVSSLLRQHLELLEHGSYEEEDGRIFLGGPARAPGTREIVGGIPAEVPPTLQAIHINDAAGLVGLGPLTAAPGLRLLNLNRSTTADLSPVRGLPVESLRAALDGGDLTPLAGHPRLAALTLRTTAPVDLTPLSTVPHLHGLDLSGAETPDLAVLAGLAGLRYLALARRQWDALLDRRAVPPALAAVRLAGDPAGDGVTFEDALALAARLGLDTGGALRVTGGVTGHGDGAVHG